MKINNIEIGNSDRCFIIAEAGSNHNRDFENAKKLIDLAVEAGADAVKFQTFSANRLYSKKTPMATYLTKEGLVDQKETLCDVMKKLELPRDWMPKLKAYCDEKGIIFMSTPFDMEAVDELEGINVDAYKVASFEITHLPMLRKISATGKPIILSTGMADLSDIETALQAIKEGGNSEVALLHCAIGYPPNPADINLRNMDTMSKAFNLPVGFSDHSMGWTTDVAAVARGACIIEKHYTLSRKQQGPDHVFSLEPDELKAMVKAIRETELILGSPVKQHTKAEEELYRIARRSLVANCDIKSGTVITEEMLAVKRPGFGIPVKYMDIVIGRTAKRDIEEDDILSWDMI